MNGCFQYGVVTEREGDVANVPRVSPNSKILQSGLTDSREPHRRFQPVISDTTPCNNVRGDASQEMSDS